MEVLYDKIREIKLQEDTYKFRSAVIAIVALVRGFDATLIHVHLATSLSQPSRLGAGDCRALILSSKSEAPTTFHSLTGRTTWRARPLGGPQS